ncbi:HutD family protein [Cryobacterium sp. Sr8]|nr:HutD family protein [Cryobacterium sp. Sr8]
MRCGGGECASSSGTGVSEPSAVRVLTAASRVAEPWRNGGGVTSEVAARPLGGGPAGFDWRLSIATIAGDNPFSGYPGVDRMLMAISPQGLDLVDGGVPVHLGQFDVHRFPGENEVAAVAVTSPTLDRNLMTRRGRCAGSLRSVHFSGLWTVEAGDGEDLALVVLDGILRLGERTLTALDAVLLEHAGRAQLEGTARVALARVARIRH